MSRYLTEAGELIRAGEYRKALRRLERARHAALGRKDLEELGQILALARTACERGGIPTGTGDLIYAITQNIRYLERRLGIEPPPLGGVPGEHISSTQPAPPAQASDDQDPAQYAGLWAGGSRDVIIRRRRIFDLVCLGLLVLTGALHGWVLFGIVLIVWPIVAFSRLFRRPAAAVTRPQVDPTAVFTAAWDEDESARGEEARSLGTVLVEAPAENVSALLRNLQSRFAELAAAVADTRPDEPGLSTQLAWLEEELRSVGRDLVALERAALLHERAAATARVEATQEPEPVRAEPLPVPAAPPIPKVTLRNRLEDVYARVESMGAKAFALVGGVVLLLGVALLLVFAAPRVFGGGDWFGPEVRLGFAGFASAIVLLLGLRIRARYGNLYAASAAVGVGLAGWYGTILASAALYDFLPALGALAAAVAVAAVGGAIALWWSSELVAGLALVGAMILPGVNLAEGNRSLLGAAFVLVLAVGTGLVGVFRRWSFVLISGVVVSAAQMVVLVADSGPSEPGHWQRLALTGGFWCVYAASGVAFQVRESSTALRQETAAVLLPGAALASWTAEHLLASDARGAALLPLAGAYAILGGGVLARTRQRDLGALLGGLAAAVAVFGFAALLTGTPLVVAWAAQAPLLAWIARQTNEPRFRLAATAYLGLALGHLLAVDSPPNRLFEAFHHPGLSAPGPLIVLVAAVLLAWYLPVAAEGGSALEQLTAWVRTGALWLAALLGLYALSLIVLELAQLGGAGLQGNFHRGHVALAIVWSTLAAAGVATRRAKLEQAGYVLLALTVVEVLAFDVLELAQHEYGVSLVAVAAGSLLASVWTRRDVVDGIVLALVSAGLAIGAVVQLFAGDGQGYALLVEGSVYAFAAAVLFRQKRRDLASLLGALSLGLGTAGCAELLSGISLVATGAAAAGLLALIAGRVGEQRLFAGAGAALGLSFGYALVHEAPPRELFDAVHHPGLGAASIALCVPAAVLIARAFPVRSTALWPAGLLGLYALSLTVLELAQALGGAGREENFHRGHVALAIVWSSLAAAGVATRRREAEWAGLGLLSLTVVEVLAFDVRELSQHEGSASLFVVATASLVASLCVRREVPESLLLALAGAGLATGALAHLFTGDALAYSLLAEAGGYTSLAVLTHRRRRDLASTLGVLAVGLGAAACVGLISGLALVATGTGAAALLALLARFEERLAIAAAALVTASLGYALVREAPPSDLFVATRHPGIGAASIALCAVAGGVLARSPRLRSAASWAAAVLGLYVLSLTVLELAQALGGPRLEKNFHHGHVALAIFWSALATAIVGAGQRLRSTATEMAGIGVLALALVVALGFDAHELSRREYAVAFLAVGAAALATAYLWQRRRPQTLSLEAVLGVVAGAALSTAAVVLLASGDARALSLLGEAAVYGLFAWLSFAGRLRDLGSVLGALALALGVAGCSGLISGVSLVAAGAGAAALLVLLGRRAAESRLSVGAGGVLALSLGYALVHDAPPSDLFVATRHPGVGAASIALCVLAAAMLLHAVRLQRPPGWTGSLWAIGALGLYALSLAVLELAQAIGTGTVHSRFQTGEAAVSGTWAAVALVFLYLGLRLQTRAFQAVGFALFGVSLGKIFLFDLPSLTALTRALSFIAVGALLLTAGFFYQRLIQQAEGGSE